SATSACSPRSTKGTRRVTGSASWRWSRAWRPRRRRYPQGVGISRTLIESADARAGPSFEGCEEPRSDAAVDNHGLGGCCKVDGPGHTFVDGPALQLL